MSPENIPTKMIMKIALRFFKAVNALENPFEATKKMSTSKTTLKAGRELGAQWLKDDLERRKVQVPEILNKLGL